MQLWLIPTFYAVGSIVGGLVVPRIEAKFAVYGIGLSTASAQAAWSRFRSGCSW